MEMNEPAEFQILRKFIISKCQEKGISVEHLAQASDCNITELKGFEQGLFILATDKLTKLIQALSITNEELISTLGQKSAGRFIQGLGFNTA
jgi:hypothetical protein